MDKDSFRKWLKVIKKYDHGTISSRISNCQRIEDSYGDLEEIYSKDKCKSLLSDLTYSRNEFNNSIQPKHRISINGDLYNGTSTLRSALNLYLQFKEDTTSQEIVTMSDIVQDQLDDSDELDVDNANYWWLNANPRIWQFGNIKVGESISYTSKNERGNKRRIYKNFEDAKKGEIVIGYEATPVKAIVALGHISGEHDGEKIRVQVDENLLEPIDLSVIESIEESKTMEPFTNNLQGSLFKLTKQEHDIIMDIIREDNPRIAPTSNKIYTKEDFLNEVFIDEEKYDSIVNLLNYKKNIILQGPPGVGKTFAAKRIAYSIMGEKDESRIEMIQFHQSYTYEDFIMGYRPVDNGFKLKNGVFYKFCRRALNDPTKPYYFIIDEINRGNISKIFGETMMLIESDKRGESYAVPLTYTENKFFIPDNVYIIGNMNTADRSLAMMDYALRRRFFFIDMMPAFDDLNFKEYLESKNSQLSQIIMDKLNRLNSAIENDISLGRGFSIGHSYFCLDKEFITKEDYDNIINYEIIPLLSEYWFDDLDKAREWKSELLER